MNRVVTIHHDEIRFDPAGAAGIVDQVNLRSASMRATGVIPIGDEILVCMEEAADTPEVAKSLRHVFAAFADESVDGVSAEVQSRYYAGFSAVGAFRLDGRLWALFAVDPRHTTHPHRELACLKTT